MNYSSAGGLFVHVTVNLIMVAKPLDTIVGQPTTKSMDRMTEQMAQMVAPLKTTAWGGLHGSLALVLDDIDYATVTSRAITLTNRLVQPPAVNPAIEDDTPQRKLLCLQAYTKNLQKHLTFKRLSPTLVYNASLTALRCSTLRSSMKTTLAMPTSG
jgi:hypothetical protein